MAKSTWFASRNFLLPLHAIGFVVSLVLMHQISSSCYQCVLNSCTVSVELAFSGYSGLGWVTESQKRTSGIIVGGCQSLVAIPAGKRKSKALTVTRKMTDWPHSFLIRGVSWAGNGLHTWTPALQHNTRALCTSCFMLCITVLFCQCYCLGFCNFLGFCYIEAIPHQCVTTRVRFDVGV